MGSTNFSSKRKSSKKKIPKISSEARRKKKIRKNKSKKLRKRADSSSDSYSDDESNSSIAVSSSSSSSEDDYRSSRRTSKKNPRKKERRRRRRSCSSSGSRGDTRGVKKRSRRKSISDARKKRPRRDPSVGSTSCSTCREDRDEHERERPRGGRSRAKEKDNGDLDMARDGSKKRRNRSPSPSSSLFSRHNEEETLATEYNSRRLKSVITVVKQPDADEVEDEHKEEMVCDNDDYPSGRSNDSIDGGGGGSMNVVGNLTGGEEASVSNFRALEQVETGKNGGEEHDVMNLESILRQKALENLKKFKKGIQLNTKAHVDRDEKAASAEIELPKLIKEKISGENYSLAKTETIKEKERGVCQSERPVLSVDSKDKGKTLELAVADKFEPNRKDSSGTFNISRKADEEEPSMANSLATGKFEPNRKDSSGTFNISRKANEEEPSMVNSLATGNNAIPMSSSGIEPSSAEQGSKEGQEEGKEGRLEKKTMSVMRGGELVQVSYKVYIPKKTPALARRQLRR